MRRLLVFVAATLVVDTSAWAAITPLLPLLSEEHALSKSEAGVLAAAYPAGTLLLSLPGAWLAMRIGPRGAVIAGLAGLAAASAAFAVATSPLALDLARFVQGGAAAAMWAGALAWVVAVAPRERRGEAIGTAVGAAVAGALLGPVLGAAADSVGIELVFGLFVLVPLAQIAWARRFAAVPAGGGSAVAAGRVALTDVSMRRGMLLMALPAGSLALLNLLVPLRLDSLGAGAPVIAAAFAGAVLLEAALAPVAGRVADRRGRLLPARVGLVAGGIALAALTLPEHAALVVVLVMVAAPMLGMLWTPAMALLSDGAEQRGVNPALGFGFSNMAWGVGALVGAGAGGALADATADAVPYALVAALALLAAARLRPAAVPIPQRSAAGQAIR